MSRHTFLPRSLALTTVCGLVLLGASAAPASADPGGAAPRPGTAAAAGHAQGRNHVTPGLAKRSITSGRQAVKPGHAHGRSKPVRDHPPQQAAPTPGHGGHGSPPGNNGTVKISGPGDRAGQPSNNPLPGCTFVVEWYGFDEGADVISRVSFAPQAPTADVGLGGTSPATVPVGGDPAGGGTDLDGRQAYTLTFDGAPHPQRGYHVKLTVHTPRAHGNDSKTKVFWVDGCEPVTPPAAPESGDAVAPGTEMAPAEQNPVTLPDAGEPAVSGSTEAAAVLGAQMSREPGTSAAQGAKPNGSRASATTPVPTVVDAGLLSRQWVRSNLPLLTVLLGLTLAAGALFSRRRRDHATHP